MGRKDDNARSAGAEVSKVGASETEFQASLCSQHHIRRLRSELANAGLLLNTTRTENQRDQLLRTLQYLGPRGLSTFEGTAAGYVRLATRIKELEDEWFIEAPRENVIGPDGLFHPRMARYKLVGKRSEIGNPQRSFDFAVVA